MELPAHSGVDININLVSGLPYIIGPLEFCACEAMWILCVNGVAKTGNTHSSHSLLVSLYSIGLLLLNTVKNPRWWHQNSKTSMRTFWARDSLQMHRSHACNVGMCRGVCTHECIIIFFWQGSADPFIDFWRSVWPQKMRRYYFRRIVAQKRTSSLCRKGGKSYFSPL